MSEKFPSLLNRILSKIELASLAIVIIGYFLVYLGRMEGGNLLLVGMSCLAGVFFLTAFLPLPESPLSRPHTKTQKGLIDLIPILLWKVIYIGCSVETIGLMFYMLSMKGYGPLLFIGTSSLLFSLMVSCYLIIRKNEILMFVQNAIIRGLMLMIMGLYILYIHWPPVK